MNPPINITIEKITSEGMGLARYNGKIIFVPFVLPGEEVNVTVVKSHKSYDEAELVEVIKPSSSRVTAPCEYYGVCGGCNLQHMAYQEQLSVKKQIVHDALTRIAKLTVVPLAEVLPSPQDFGYRSRIQLQQNQRGEWGFNKRKSHDVVAVKKCLLASDTVNQKINSLSRAAQDRLEVSEDSSGFFTQVNKKQNDHLIDLVMKLAGEMKPNVALELYAGAGNFTFPLSEYCEKIWAVESSVDAVSWAKGKALSLNNDKIEWHAVEAKKFIKSFGFKNIHPDLLLVDPPRAGLEGLVVPLIALEPKNIIYVSCDPATFARDIKTMMEEGKYTLERVYPVDMFPQTAHVEVVGILTRKK